MISSPWFTCDLLNGLHFRYHYNVADTRLSQHVERGIADGLLISCVSSCSNLWALIMDAGTGYSNQVYKLSPFFLHKVKYAVHLAVFYKSNFMWLNLFMWLRFFAGMDLGTVG